MFFETLVVIAVAGGLGLVYGEFLSLLIALARLVTVVVRLPSVSLQDILVGLETLKKNSSYRAKASFECRSAYLVFLHLSLIVFSKLFVS